MDKPDFKRIVQDLASYEQMQGNKLVEREELKTLASVVISAWKRLYEAVEKRLGGIEKTVATALHNTQSEIAQESNTQKREIIKALQSESASIRAYVEETIAEHASDIGYLQDSLERREWLKELTQKVDDIRDRVEYLAEELEEEDDEEEEPEVPQEVLDELRALRELYDELKNRKVVANTYNASVSGRDIITDIDLTTQLNGVAKTFNIPAVYNIISISLSSYPYGSLRKGIDYTWTPTTITFTDEIGADTQLSAGQKCIITAILA